jgi:hypothetical protein
MADADPYDLLGVARDASQRDIQKAYRRLAKKLHPDLNPGDKDAQRKFQQLSAASSATRRSERGSIAGKSTHPEPSRLSAVTIANMHRREPVLSVTRTLRVLPISATPTIFFPLSFHALVGGKPVCAARTVAIVSRWTFSFL